MQLEFTAEEIAFREDVRAFIDEHLPKATRERLRQGYPPARAETIAWQRALNAKGWAVPGWPVEYGGTGWSAVQRYIFLEEQFAAPTPEPLSFNVNMVGPVIIAFGSLEQKARFLPRIRNLDDWWCQGFSEPGSGSDLASLRTTAVRRGDEYVVNGQKIWTSTAHNADWIFALVRTDSEGLKKQYGISFLLIDLRTPGITIRPIISIDGGHHLNEVFFDDVRVPAGNIVGEENKGWSYAKFLLGNERTGIARVGKSQERLGRARELAALVHDNGHSLLESDRFREKVTLAEIELKALEITQMRVMARAKRDGRPDPASSVLKLVGSTMLQQTNELLMEVGGIHTAIMPPKSSPGDNEPPIGPDWVQALAGAYFMSRAASIYGGSNEIQKNIIAKAALGL